jgi:hypothetical protein
VHADPDDLGRGKCVYIYIYIYIYFLFSFFFFLLCSPSWLNNLTWALQCWVLFRS